MRPAAGIKARTGENTKKRKTRGRKEKKWELTDEEMQQCREQLLKRSERLSLLRMLCAGVDIRSLVNVAPNKQVSKCSFVVDELTHFPSLYPIVSQIWCKVQLLSIRCQLKNLQQQKTRTNRYIHMLLFHIHTHALYRPL